MTISTSILKYLESKGEPMRTYRFRGNVKLSGVEFVVEATGPEDARNAARAGHHKSVDFATGEMVDWEIKPDTIEEDR